MYEIASGAYRARIGERGAALHELSFGGEPLVVPFEQTTPKAFSGMVLAPWPNRLDGGSYRFGARSFTAPINEPATNTALHGLVFDHTWQPAACHPSSLTLRTKLPQSSAYPSALELDATYSLSPEGLTWRVTARNVGDSTAPYGVSVHPYLTCGQGPIDECRVTLPATRALLTDERLLPSEIVEVTGTDLDLSAGLPLASRRIDHAYTGLSPEWEVVVARPRAGFETVLRARTPWVQLYSGEEIGRAGAAVEPMTCPPNALRTAGAFVLEPGACHTFELRVFARHPSN